jgi:hypothetical protein
MNRYETVNIFKTFSVRSTLTLVCHLRLGLQTVPSLEFSTKILYQFLISLMLLTYSTYRILLDLISLKTP